MTPQNSTLVQRQLQGPWLPILRLVWFMVAATIVAILVVGTPLRWQQLQIALPQESRMLLSQLFGLSIQYEAIYAIGIELVYAATYFGCAILIFWRKPNDWLAWLVSTMLMTFGISTATIDHALTDAFPSLLLLTNIIQAFGTISLVIVLYVLPDGRFIPPWTRWLALIWTLWGLTWPFFLAWPANIINAEVWSSTPVLSVALSVFWFGSGAAIQLYRYRAVSTPTEKQQTKWVVLGLIATLIGAQIRFITPLIIPELAQRSGYLIYIDYWLGLPVTVVPLMLAPILFTFAVLRYRLWDIDPLVNRLMVYGLSTIILTVAYVGFIFGAQQLLGRLNLGLNFRSPVLVIGSTILIGASVMPLRNQLQNQLDRRFYRSHMALKQIFEARLVEMRTMVDQEALLSLLADQLPRDLAISTIAVYLRDTNKPTNQFYLARTTATTPMASIPDTFPATLVDNAGCDKAIIPPQAAPFALIIPLCMIHPNNTEIVGVLGLGPWQSGQGYAQRDQTRLAKLSSQAGTALYVAQIVAEKQITDRRLQAYRASPEGQAEVTAHQIKQAPDQALSILTQLADQATVNPDAAAQLAHLSQVLVGYEQTTLAAIAEGFHDLVRSEAQPALLEIGLETLITHLAHAQFTHLNEAPLSQTIYTVARQWLAPTNLNQLVALQPEALVHNTHPLALILLGYVSVTEQVQASVRATTFNDKTTYLATSLSHISQADRLARTDLAGTNRLIAQQILTNWRHLITDQLSHLQTQARLNCYFVTQQIAVADTTNPISLQVRLRNEGRGTARNLALTITPSATFAILDSSPQLGTLAPQAEIDIEIVLQPLKPNVPQTCQIEVCLQYDDPLGPSQQRAFTHKLRLVPRTNTFTFIPNPYVVGPPLPTESTLFVGRESLIEAIVGEFSTNQPNNLVLIGQRRMGKTSLLRQIERRLASHQLVVFLDGQSLVADTGLSPFFLRLATEIVFALEDAGFALAMPTYEQFAESPTTTFEYHFLPAVLALIGERRLILLIDEFEELDTVVQQGHLSPTIFKFLRHLIQHTPQLNLVLCGSHRLEALTADYWHDLFNISLYRNVGYLAYEPALQLIQRPVSAYHMQYDDLALDKIWRVTSGHPYFIQRLCHNLVEIHNRTEKSYITLTEVNVAIDEVITGNEAHFIYLWQETSLVERLILLALQQPYFATQPTTPVEINTYLTRQNIATSPADVRQALQRLAQRDILLAVTATDDGTDKHYRWKLQLLGLWVADHQTFAAIMDEAQ